MMPARATRPDLRIMDAYDGEHYPVEVDMTYYAEVGDDLVEIGTGRQMLCGCTDDLANDWPHS